MLVIETSGAPVGRRGTSPQFSPGVRGTPASPGVSPYRQQQPLVAREQFQRKLLG